MCNYHSNKNKKMTLIFYIYTYTAAENTTCPQDTSYDNCLRTSYGAHSSALAWRIPGTGEPGELPSMGSHRVGHDWSDLAAAACSSYATSCKEKRIFHFPTKVITKCHRGLLGNDAGNAYLQVILASIIRIFKFFCNCSSTIIYIVGLIQHSWKLQFTEICVLSKVWRVSQGRLGLTDKKAFAGPSSATNSRRQGIKNEASGTCLVAQFG